MSPELSRSTTALDSPTYFAILDQTPQKSNVSRRRPRNIRVRAFFVVFHRSSKHLLQQLLFLKQEMWLGKNIRPCS
jgi:hypothetical protein